MTSQSKGNATSPAKYWVILSGNVMPECDRQQVVEGLADLFNSQASTMENLLKGHPVPLKKQYDKEQAQIICDNIRAVGAQCTLEEISASELTDNLRSIEVKHEVDSKTSSAAQRTDVAPTDAPTDAPTGVPIDAPTDAGHSNKEKHHALLMQFVNKNADYYQHQFSKFTVADEASPDKSPPWSTYKISWHWPAFFCFFFWALYRKMWVWAAIYGIGGLGLTLWVNSAVVSLIWLFIWPVLANYLYFRAAATAVSQIMAYPETAQRHLQKGGVSKVAVWGGIIIMLISTVLISNYMTHLFLDEYGEQIKAVLPGSGTQIRGTGLSLESVVGESKLARTSLILSALATSLKILLIRNNAQNNEGDNTDDSPPMQSVISIFIEHLNSGEVSDSWGGKIRVEQQVNRYVLISAGPDRVFKTDDDVIQPVIIY